jgi:hypothetical protein
VFRYKAKHLHFRTVHRKLNIQTQQKPSQIPTNWPAFNIKYVFWHIKVNRRCIRQNSKWYAMNKLNVAHYTAHLSVDWHSPWMRNTAILDVGECLSELCINWVLMSFCRNMEYLTPVWYRSNRTHHTSRSSTKQFQQLQTRYEISAWRPWEVTVIPLRVRAVCF